MSVPRRLSALVLASLVTGCGAEAGGVVDGQVSGGDVLLTTRAPVTVIDDGDGDGAELCLGGVQTSLPPQCGGPRLPGWDWAAHAGHHETYGGVRWGEFVVTGTFDGTAFRPTEVVPSALAPAPSAEPPVDERFETPCPEPAGGWPQPPGLTHDDLDLVARRAQHLDGYGGLWLDTARDARPPEQVDQDAAAGRDDVSRWIVNVRVTGDVAEARQFLRQVWPGGLCVVPGERTEADLRAVQRELTDQPGMLSAGVDDQHVALEVVHDDGTLQRRLDERYGRGVVVVTSALQPVR